MLSKHAHSVFCEGVKGVVGACRRRLTWLTKGSRQLFGTLLEKKIVIVVDTSVSMGTRLTMLKEKLLELIKVSLVPTVKYFLQLYSCSYSLFFIFISSGAVEHQGPVYCVPL